MELSSDRINWVAVGVGLVVAQAYLTVWFVALFPQPWAKEYGARNPKEHTKSIPGYTYAIGAGCALALNLGIATLHSTLGIEGVAAALLLGLFLALHFSLATAIPGYAFLRRWKACLLAMGSQTTLILLLSVIHVLV